VKKISFILCFYLFGVSCPLHSYATCYNTGQVKYTNGHSWHKWDCSCGDSWWIED